ncbi:hypothetical protein GWP43_05090 [Treponema vincentii]|uniref:Uncharacterized protein n=1 Tax=Treponema vincentii TaxID=69710 RepID=A0A6P1Y0M1_9SPIR|nr:hypothetical protein [Treponema vincentii]QHX42919.1 hypothetical protein GWP43_05090 [Treponema vincentii]
MEKQNDLLTDERRLSLLSAISVGENIFTIGSENNKIFLFKSKDFGVTWDNTNIEAHEVFSDSEDVFILRYDALYKISANFLNEEKIYESHGTEEIINMVLNKEVWIVQTHDRLCIILDYILARIKVKRGIIELETVMLVQSHLVKVLYLWEILKD